MQVHETDVRNFSSVRTKPHSVVGQQNFTTNFHVDIRNYGLMATTTTTTVCWNHRQEV